MSQANFSGLPHAHLKLDLYSLPAVNDTNKQPHNVDPCNLQLDLPYGIARASLLLDFHIHTCIFLFPTI